MFPNLSVICQGSGSLRYEIQSVSHLRKQQKVENRVYGNLVYQKRLVDVIYEISISICCLLTDLWWCINLNLLLSMYPKSKRNRFNLIANYFVFS